MKEHRHKSLSITANFYQLGTPSFPVYLSLGEEGMIIEGGTGATAMIIAEQVKELGIPPERIKYMALTHTHGDHIGAIPYLKSLWPHLKIIASPLAAATLAREDSFKGFLRVDKSISEIMLGKGEVTEVPQQPLVNPFSVDIQVSEGQQIDLGSGVVWNVLETPGHSPCHISFYDETDGTLAIGDATGFYLPQLHVFWPNYFESLEKYCHSIRKLSTIPAKRGALSHNGVVEDVITHYFDDALSATECYHSELTERLGKGEDGAVIAHEKAKWVNSLTDIQTFEAINFLSKVLLGRTKAESGKTGLFEVPAPVIARRQNRRKEII